MSVAWCQTALRDVLVSLVYKAMDSSWLENIFKRLIFSVRFFIRRRFVESQLVVSQINADKKPHKLPINDLNRNIEDDKEKIKPSLYGHEILDAMDSLESPYNVRFPLKRGDLDLDPAKVYGSESSTLTDIEVIKVS